MKGKKIIRSVAIVLGIIGLLAAIGFANNAQNALEVKSFTVSITNLSEGDPFLDEKEIKLILSSKLDTFVGKESSAINLLEIEELIEMEPVVKNAEAYLGVSGALQLDVALKTVIVRIKPSDNNGYYLDKTGLVMPWVSSYTPRVLSLNGWINRYCIETLPQLSDSARTDVMNKELYAFANFVYRDEFWSKQLVQLYLNYDGDVELVTLIGEQKITLGSFQGGEKKLEKLNLYYEQVVNKVGWNEYEEVNLKFENQIVCK